MNFLVNPKETQKIDLGSIKWIVTVDGEKLDGMQILDANPSPLS
jgi:hypothetical protein